MVYFWAMTEGKSRLSPKAIKAYQDTLRELPRGYVARKVIAGKERFYLQWREGKKIKSKYLRADEVDDIREQIRRRHAIETELVNAGVSPVTIKRTRWAKDFETSVKTGEELRRFVDEVKDWKHRAALDTIQKYLRVPTVDHVLIVYGLRRTGKTTLLRQAIVALSDEDFAKAAYIRVSPHHEMAELGRDLEKLNRSGYKYVFIDEVTLMADFVMGAALLSDIYAGMGMKIVLSGTDSLGFWLSLKDELYDRAYLVHTTFIPFREHALLLKTDDVDDYIRFGGTLRKGSTDFDDPNVMADDASFRDDETTRTYVDTAIASNIQHSLRLADDGRYLGALSKLYEAGELTNAINRLIEDMNRRFVVEVVTRRFISHDLGSAAQALAHDRNPKKRTDVLHHINRKAITKRLMELLSIKDPPEQKVVVTEAHLAEIQHYLSVLDLIMTCPVVSANPKIAATERILFTQPGMRFAQAEALVHSLRKDAIFNSRTEEERERVCNRLESDILGRMLEDVVLCETMRTIPYRRDKYKQLRVFKLTFDAGEFDMVVFDPEKLDCRLFEIKHTAERDEGQLRHLTDPEKLVWCERNYGPILSRTVLYRGEPFKHPSGVVYRNVGEYLKGLGEALGRDSNPVRISE